MFSTPVAIAFRIKEIRHSPVVEPVPDAALLGEAVRALDRVLVLRDQVRGLRDDVMPVALLREPPPTDDEAPLVVEI